MEQVIVGVTHEDHLYPHIVKFLDARYPSVSSAMIEIPENWREYTGVFPRLARHLEGRDVRIIVGDLKYWTVFKPTAHASLESALEESKKLQDILHISSAALDGRLLRDRNESMNQIFQQEHPELTIVGSRHAKYLKKRNPQVPFVCLDSTNLVHRVTGLDIGLYADETIRFPQSREDLMYQSLFLTALGAGIVWGAGILSPELTTTGLMAYSVSHSILAFSRRMKSSRESRGCHAVAGGCGAFMGATLTGAATLGMGYILGSAINSI